MIEAPTADSPALQLASTIETTAYARACAVGIAIDNPDDPHVAVVVYQGRIVYIGISDPMLRVGLDALQDQLNALIFNAFAMWRMQLAGVNR